MILVTGPTGSGKTHHALRDPAARSLDRASTSSRIENPIEYQLQGINQVEVNEKQGLDLRRELRSILRQDPDVILVGEIRDNETAQIALQAAQTGHLVLSTVHTNDATATITRLLDLGIEPSLISASLRLVIAQRLVRSLCPKCVRPLSPPSELDLARLSRHGRGSPRPPPRPAARTAAIPASPAGSASSRCCRFRAACARCSSARRRRPCCAPRRAPRAYARCRRQRWWRSTRDARRSTRCCASCRRRNGTPRRRRTTSRPRPRPCRVRRRGAAERPGTAPSRC